MPTEDVKLVSVRAMDLGVAVVLLLVAAVVMTDSLRLGVGWRESEGPTAGYFPFYIGLFLAVASGINLGRAWFDRAPATRTFVTRTAIARVLAVLLPFGGYVLALGFIGLYVASALYIALFMWWFGRYPPSRGIAVGVMIAMVLFLMFEVWFLVPLPKGPLEQFLGY
ncbi:MAG TPA: tripartite tricarboxylate transporter TctB family protein [Hyphomicrobiaceae bacterium]|nr:tripartite tricarboxylate transporter TctB family protein [Hyphomicrobiaceae bacterium]